METNTQYLLTFYSTAPLSHPHPLPIFTSLPLSPSPYPPALPPSLSLLLPPLLWFPSLKSSPRHLPFPSILTLPPFPPFTSSNKPFFYILSNNKTRFTDYKQGLKYTNRGWNIQTGVEIYKQGLKYTNNKILESKKL